MRAPRGDMEGKQPWDDVWMGLCKSYAKHYAKQHLSRKRCWETLRSRVLEASGPRGDCLHGPEPFLGLTAWDGLALDHPGRGQGLQPLPAPVCSSESRSGHPLVCVRPVSRGKFMTRSRAACTRARGEPSPCLLRVAGQLNASLQLGLGLGGLQGVWTGWLIVSAGPARFPARPSGGICVPPRARGCPSVDSTPPGSLASDQCPPGKY